MKWGTRYFESWKSALALPVTLTDFVCGFTPPCQATTLYLPSVTFSILWLPRFLFTNLADCSPAGAEVGAQTKSHVRTDRASHRQVVVRHGLSYLRS